MEVRFTTSDSGDNCDNACEAIGEECVEDMLFLQSAEEVSSWALEVGVACSQILDRCDIGESPIFLEDDGVCTFCSNPNHPGWDNGNRCGAQWDIRQRICPCTSTLAESTSTTTTPEESTTELPDGLVRGWPKPVGSPLRHEWFKCNNCGWLPSSVGGVVERMPQNDLGLTWHEACALWCEEEPDCVSAWHRISGNHCSLYNFTLPFGTNNNISNSHIYVKPMSNPITTSLAVSTSDYVSLMDTKSRDYLSHGNHQCDSYSDSRDVAIEEAKVYCSSHSDCGGFAVSQVWESFCPQFFSNNPTTYDNSAWTFFVKSEKENSNAFDGFTFITKDQGPADCGEFIGCDYGDEALQMQWCTETNCDLIQWCPANGEGLMSPSCHLRHDGRPRACLYRGCQSCTAESCDFNRDPNMTSGGVHQLGHWYTYFREATQDPTEPTLDPVVTSVYKKTDCRFDYSSTVRSAGDYGAHLNTPKTLEECEALCDAHPGCASFVVDQMGGGKCHLRTECPLVNEACIEASSWGFINYVKEDCEASAPTSLPDDLPSDIPSGSPSYAPSLAPITSSPSMHPSIVPSSTPSALPTNRRPSVAPTIKCAEGYELKQGMPMHGRGCTSEGISCTQRIYLGAPTRISTEECAALCSDSELCVAYSQDQGSFRDMCVTIDMSFYYRYNVHTREFHQGKGTYCEKAHTTMRPFDPEAKFTTSEPGQSCKDACESIEEECRSDLLFLQSAEEVASWALKAGVTCTSIVEQCSLAVAPLFDWSHPKFTNNEVVCTFCSEPEWKYGPVCNARFGSNTRICPCSSTWSSAPTKTPTTFPTDLPTLAGYEGSMCDVDDDCDSERCNFGEYPSRCREKEDHSSECNRDGDCESDLCLGRKCVDGRLNDRCTSNDDCQSGRCAFGIPFGDCRELAEHGNNCIRNNDCASQHCLLSTCTDHRDGAHCANDDDCLEGSSCVWSRGPGSKTGATCQKNHGCTWWNWLECSENCTWFQKVTMTCY